MQKPYFQHKGKVVETDNRFKHVMAIALDPRTDYKEGIIRCITSRGGDVKIKGSVDRSELYKISGSSLESFKIGERLNIKNEKEIVEQLGNDGLDFLGLEDPDIFIDEKTGLTHLYFTMPFIAKDKIESHSHIHLGHAVGKSLDALVMIMPSLKADGVNSAKEVSVAPENSKGIRCNLVESSSIENGTYYSTVRVGIAENIDKPWKYGETAFHPKEHSIPWIAGHASPGPLLPKSFIDIGERKLLGVINGRETNQKIGEKIKYGIFSVGLFIYDYENGKIEWVSPEPFIRDTEATTITFASQFVETKQGEGILYAHVDDSFVRAYTLKAELLKTILPAKFVL